MQLEFMVRFWGVRGSIPCPGPGTVRYGGNTPCVEVRCGERLIIFDGGSGIRPLGDSLAAGRPLDADIYLSHCHYDHVGGLPFFAPFFDAGNRFRLWAGNLLPQFGCERMMRTLMSHPLFPIEIDSFSANIDYRDFRAGEILTPFPGARLVTGPLDHPDGATGYRLEYGGRVLSYLTDNEGGGKDFGSELLALARGADLAIYDCTFTDDEIGSKAGWGHSSWHDGLRLADAAGIKRLCMFHHAPEHDDAFMDAIAAEAERLRPGTIVARESTVIKL
jgi:phosphoribosyl 1,2-cyclic phosphodiesterase